MNRCSIILDLNKLTMIRDYQTPATTPLATAVTPRLHLFNEKSTLTSLTSQQLTQTKREKKAEQNDEEKTKRKKQATKQTFQHRKPAAKLATMYSKSSFEMQNPDLLAGSMSISSFKTIDNQQTARSNNSSIMAPNFKRFSNELLKMKHVKPENRLNRSFNYFS